MLLTSSMLDTFIGGQLEVQNQGEGYLYRGEIKTAEVKDDGTIEINLNWMAKAEGYPPLPKGWVADKRLRYEASLEIYSASDIGHGSEGGGRRLCLNSSITGETVVFFPRDGSKLDPSKVRGLTLSAA